MQKNDTYFIASNFFYIWQKLNFIKYRNLFFL